MKENLVSLEARQLGGKVNTREIMIGNNKAEGIEIGLGNAVLVLAIGKKGYIMCGYLNLEAAEKFGDCAAIVKGVKTVDDLLAAKVFAVTKNAEKSGINAGMSGREALEKLF